MTPSQEYVKRYTLIEREVDARGRQIGVGRLKVSQQMKIAEMTPGLEGAAEIEDDQGRAHSIPRRSIPLLAASVREIDGSPYPFPKTRGELDALMDMLDDEGLVAVSRALARLAPSDAVAGETEIDAAKK